MFPLPRRLFLFCLLLPALPSAAAPVLLRPALPGDPLAAQAWRLDNGLEVHLSVNRERPRFFAEIVVRAGSKNDPADCTGLAHYLEHLLFKGSTRLGVTDAAAEQPLLDRITALYEEHFQESDPARRADLYRQINAAAREAAAFAIANEFDTLYQELGATEVNAHTSVEETVYKCAMPANRLEAWAKVEADRFANPVFRLFHTELETVYEEKNRSMDNRFSPLYEAIDRKLFPVHPYGQQTTLGEAEHLKRPSLKRIREFYDTWYVPANMALCLSGDIDPEQALRAIDRAFGAWPARPVPPPPAWKDDGPARPERVETRHPGEEYVQIAYRTVPAGHPDEDALTLVDMVLDNSVAGLINLHLNQPQKVKQAGCYPQFMRDAGVHRFWGMPKEGQTVEEVETLLLGEIDKVRRGEFDASLLPAILADLERSEMRALEDNEQRVGMLRDDFVLGRDRARAAGRLDRLRQLGKDDLVRAAARYYGEARVTGLLRDGKREAVAIAKPPIDPLPLVPGRRSAFAQEVLALPAAPITPRFLVEGRDYTLARTNAIELVCAPNPLNRLFTLELVIDRGWEEEPRLPEALRWAEKCGAGEVAARDLALAWYRLGAEWSFEVDRHTTVLRLSGMDDRLEESVKLWREQLLHPRPEGDTWAGLLAIVRQERADERKDPQTVFDALGEFQAHGARSGFLRRATMKDLEATPEAGLPDLLRRLLTAPASAVYTGAEAPGRAARLLAEGWPERPLVKREAPRPDPLCRVPVTNEVWWVRQDTAQTLLRLARGDGPPREERVPGAQVFNTYFGTGMASLVFQQIREARALAYSAWSAYVPGRDPREENRVVAELGTQCDKTVEALEAITSLLRDMPLEADRLERARAGVLNRYRADPLSFREAGDAVRRWRALGIFTDPRPARMPALEAFTTADLARFHRERVAAGPWLICLVGDPGRFDPAALARFGAAREIAVAELFSE